MYEYWILDGSGFSCNQKGSTSTSKNYEYKYTEQTHHPLVMTNIANWKITMLLMGKSTISMAIFNSYVSLPEGISH